MAAPALAGGLGLHGVQDAVAQPAGVHAQVSASRPSSFTVVPPPVPARPPNSVIPVENEAAAGNSRAPGPVLSLVHDQVLEVVLKVSSQVSFSRARQPGLVLPPQTA